MAAMAEGLSTASLTPTQHKMLTALRKSVDRVTRTALGASDLAREHHLKGVFPSLTEPMSMKQVLFPGTPPDVLRALPQTLREVLKWEDLTLDLPAIAKSAAQVLENIKQKGARMGDVMDEVTERVLTPQIAQEALARAVIDGVRQLNRKVSQTVAQSITEVADPQSEKAQRDQLDEDVVEDLLARGHACQMEFVGAEWAQVIREDMLRFLASEKMSLIDDKGQVQLPEHAHKAPAESVPCRMSWIESDDDLRDRYPALAEAVAQLHALPHELNRKCAFPEMALLEPMRGCTQLAYFPPQAAQSARLDCRDDRPDLDTGIRLTACHHLRASPLSEAEETGTGAAAVFEAKYEQPAATLLQDDTLTLHRATSVKNARTADAQYGWFALCLFVHGRSRDREREREREQSGAQK